MQILTTKLNRPMVDNRWVPRLRLIKALDSALNQRATLLSAPAGYGKTTLVAQWLDHTATPAAWLSLDRHDGDPDRFLKYVTAAVRSVFPDFGPALEALLSASILPPPDYLADALIDDLAALNRPLVIVLDDFHHFVSEPVLELLTRLVQFQPEHLHLIITTRVDPALPLSQWRVRNWLVELRAAELRFREEEAQAYFEQTLSRDAVDLIFQHTEGWAAGLQLARLSLDATENPEALARRFSGKERMIADFLTDEVVARQTPEIREFMAVTALLERFCTPLCDALLDDGPDHRESREFIFQLEQENLFIVPLDGERVWYRYHHLFKSLLMHHMQADLTEERKTRIFRRAGQWFAGQGLTEEALTYFLAAGDIDDAAALVEVNLDPVLDQDPSRRTLKRWLDMFPASALKKQPAPAVAQVFCKMLYLDRSDIDPLLDAAQAVLTDPACTLSESRRRKLLAVVDIQRGFYLYWGGDPAGALKHTLRALKNLPDASSFPHSVAVMYAALAYAMTGSRDKGLQLLAEATSSAYATGNPYVSTFLFTRAGILYYAGELDGVEPVLQQVVSLHNIQAAHRYWSLHAHWILGCIAYERNRLDVAEAHLQRVEGMRYQLNTRPYHDCLIGLALVALARGDSVKAREHADAARDFAVECKDAYSMAFSDALNIRLDMAGHPATTAAAPPPIDANQIFMETPALTYAEHLLCKADPADRQAGLAYAQSAVEQLRQHHNTRQLIQFMAVYAVALKRTGRLKQALEALQEALEMAEPLGFVRAFVDRGKPMAELLSDLSAKRPRDEYLKALLGAYGDKPPVETAVVYAVAHRSPTEQPTDHHAEIDLSNRELDVLELLGKRLTDKEIGQQLFISPLTAKKHAASIYRKMNVAGRRQAVAAARKLGILKSK